ncbi:sigma-70 family RNA polymerase sigma factor [Chryseolinea sp. T2]|uniref:RNA polymerase sigma factor n=1 Tax=Chryseolinea sp. T2 TaxID=3129255 RepID=UPI0030771179
MLCSDNPTELQKAWNQLYLRCYPQIRSLILKKGGTLDEAHDLLQDALTALLVNLRENKFESRASVSTYLYGICFRLFCKRFHKLNKKLTAELEFWNDQILASDYDPERDIMWDRVATALMDKLGPECREVLVEFYFNNKSMRELQARYDVNSEQAMKNKKMRCLKYLRDLIDLSDLNPEIKKK